MRLVLVLRRIFFASVQHSQNDRRLSNSKQSQIGRKHSTKVNIGLNELNYKLKAECSYCDVVYPTNRYKGDKIRDGQRVSLEGTVETGGGSVIINSRYGGVKLTQ